MPGSGYAREQERKISAYVHLPEAQVPLLYTPLPLSSFFLDKGTVGFLLPAFFCFCEIPWLYPGRKSSFFICEPWALGTCPYCSMWNVVTLFHLTP